MTIPPDQKIPRKDIVLLFLAFLLSRLLLPFFGLHFRYDALFIYWQYLDPDTLRHHLAQGLWYDHAQPPLFNLLLGLVLKLSGPFAPTAFALLLKGISLINALLLYGLLKRTAPRPAWLPLVLTLLYLLSPALMIFETELFYTTFISMLLLISATFIQRFSEAVARQKNAAQGPTAGRQPHPQWTTVAGICLPLALLCLTRSLYHLAWLLAIGALLLYPVRKTPGFRPLLAGFLLAALIVSGWYLKNYLIFKQFSTSSWVGMNIARTVFHDAPVKDSTRIEAFEPFSDLPYYHPFLSDSAIKQYAGLDDRDLLMEKKSDSSSNLNAVAYIQVSQQYMTASKAFVKAHPGRYLSNVAQSSLLFFAPATKYPFSEIEARKIKYYDLVYSFNLSHFATGKTQRRIAVAVSAIPKLLVYLAVFYILLRNAWTGKHLSLLNLFAFGAIAYVFLLSSLLEHYENMRFRYEIEPLFLVLLGQALTLLTDARKKQYLGIKIR
jgi:hypothetical protein